MLPNQLSNKNMDAFNFRDVFSASANSVISSLLVFLVAALAHQVQESLHFGLTALGLIISLYYLSAAVSSVPLSRLVEALGSVRAMRWGSLLMGVLFILLAAAVHSFVALAAVMVAAGMVSSGLQSATNLFLVRRIPSAHRGLAFGFKQAAVPVTVLLGGLSVPAIALTIGWRWAFVIASALAFAVSASTPIARMTFAAYRSRPPIPPLGRKEIIILMLLALGFALGVAAASALSAFIVTAVISAGYGETAAGLLAALGGFSAASTRIAVGIHVDRGAYTPLVVVAAMLTIGAAAYLILAVSSMMALWLLVFGVVLAFSAGWGWNGLFNLAVVSRYPFRAARATGITSVGGRVGGVIGPFAFGVVISQYSYAAAWSLAAVAALGSALIILAGQRLLHRNQLVARHRLL